MKTLMIAGKKVVIPIKINGTWYYFYARCNIFNQYWSIWLFREEYPLYHAISFNPNFFYAMYAFANYEGRK